MTSPGGSQSDRAARAAAKNHAAILKRAEKAQRKQAKTDAKKEAEARLNQYINTSHDPQGSVVSPNQQPAQPDTAGAGYVPTPESRDRIHGGLGGRAVMLVGIVVGALVLLVLQLTPLPLLLDFAAAVMAHVVTTIVIRKRENSVAGDNEVPRVSLVPPVITGEGRQHYLGGENPTEQVYRPPIEFKWRRPPTEGKPDLLHDGELRTFSNRLRLGFAVLWFFGWIGLTILTSTWYPWWINLIVAGLGCWASIYFYAEAVVKKRDDRDQLLRGMYDELDHIMWSELSDQHVPNRMMWRIACAIQSGSKYIRFSTRSVWWQLLRKIRKPVYLAVIFSTILALLIVVLYKDWTPEWLYKFYPAIYLSIIGILVLLLLDCWYIGLEWYYWVYVQTDEWLIKVRLFPIWFPWKEDIIEPVSIQQVGLAKPKKQPKGNILRFGRVVLKESGGLNDSDVGENDFENSRLEFNELFFMKHHHRIAWLINRDVKRNEEEQLREQEKQRREQELLRKVQEDALAAQRESNQLLKQLVQQGGIVPSPIEDTQPLPRISGTPKP